MVGGIGEGPDMERWVELEKGLTWNGGWNWRKA